MGNINAAGMQYYSVQQCCPTRGPRAACGTPDDFKWPARVSLSLSNLCFQNDVTDKTWLNTWKFHHKSSSSDALNLFQHRVKVSAMAASYETAEKDRHFHFVCSHVLTLFIH